MSDEIRFGGCQRELALFEQIRGVLATRRAHSDTHRRLPMATMTAVLGALIMVIGLVFGVGQSPVQPAPSQTAELSAMQADDAMALQAQLDGNQLTPADLALAHYTGPDSGPPLAIPAASFKSNGTMGGKLLALARTKLGKPYRWGATGPNAFDCSGLVKWAADQLDLPLPRTSRAQSLVGQPVAKGDLQPGDLVFFYSPVSHVGIYAGDGLVLHASTSGQPVKYTAMAYMPFTTARRL